MDIEHAPHPHMRPPTILDYSLTGENANRAIELGLAEADWYQTPVPRTKMRELLVRKNGPAIRDSLIWFGLLIGLGYLTWVLWGSWWAILPYIGYAVIYATTSDSRWHESSHGTAFRTDWMNNVLYEISSFMVMRESTVWRWSHTRHHSDTIIVGRDPEISIPRPPDIKAFVLSFINIGVYIHFYKSIVIHSLGRMTEDEKTFIPETEFPKVYRRARVYLVIMLSVIGLSIWMGSIFPLMLVGLTNLFGTWLMPIYGLTQHAGLAENVLDHRLNCRTVYMNVVHRYLYWNMNYHVEHHMFPLVPYHALPKLHEVVKHDYPEPYPGLWTAWKEILPAIFKQVKDPTYHVKRKLPKPSQATQASYSQSKATPDSEGWIDACAADELGKEDVVRFDHLKKTFAIYKNANGQFFATDGICTHGNNHLADGLVKGNLIECPKHNGRFNLEDGAPARAPICRGLATYPVKRMGDRLLINIENPGGVGAREDKAYRFKVVSNQNVSTFIKELVLEFVEGSEAFDFNPGDYMQFDIPTYRNIHFAELDIPEPYASVWNRQHVFDLNVSNDEGGRRNNYSIANYDPESRQVSFNIRIATPPPGQDCPPGVGSSYMFSLKAGDELTAIGSFGDFHIKPTQKEMVYIGGGAGMAPLRAHLTNLFHGSKPPTARKVSFWYGARSKQELFYEDIFQEIATTNPNFDFQVALSDPLDEDEWQGHAGFIHNVVEDEYLKNHPHPNTIEFYLCGPPMMIKACVKMLRSIGVADEQIAFDEF